MAAFTPLNDSNDAGVGSNDVRDEMKTFYKKGLLKYAEKRTVLAQFGQNATIPKNQGQIYEWRIASQLTDVTGAATLLTEGVTPDGSSIHFVKMTATVAQYGDYYAGTDLLDETIYDPIRTIVVDAQSYQMAQVMDNLISVAAVLGATNRRYSNAASGGTTTHATIAAGDIITETEIRKVVRDLRRASAKPLRDGNFVAVIHPDTTYTLFQDPDIREAMVNSKNMKGGDNAGNLFTGEIGQYMGVTFIETELARVVLAGVDQGSEAWQTTNASVDVYETIFFAADYFGKIKLTGLNSDSIYHPVGSSGGADALNQRWTQGWKMTFGARLLFPLYAVVLEHANAL